MRLRSAPRAERPEGDGLPAVRIGILGGLTALSCCVGPTVLALIGAVSGATALAWADGLYNGYAWFFRLGGLVVLGLLVWWALERRNACSLPGARRHWRRIALALAVAVATYGVLYALTTWLGTLA